MGSSSEFYRVLAECVEAVESGQRTVDECLVRYPEHRADLEQVLPLVSALRHVPRVEPPAGFRRGARERLLEQLPATNRNVTSRPRPRYKEQRVRPSSLRRSSTMTWIAAIAVIASLLAGGGMAYAADGAAPGDALYTLDRTIEEVRLQLTSNPEAKFELQLALATERLEEAQDLLSRAGQDAFAEALGNYDASVALIAETVQSSAAAGQAVLDGLLEQAIASHDTLLGDMVYGDQVRAGDMVQIRDQDRLSWCSEPLSETVEIAATTLLSDMQHPVALALAETWGVTYDEVIGYFCQGYGFGEIGLAFRISEGTGIPVADLLAEHADSGMGWGLLLQQYDLIGPVKARGSDGAPQGPVDAGGQGEGPKSQGPVKAGEGDGPQEPQDPQGPQEPQGPHAQEGRPEEAGPPADVPQGPPAGQGPTSGQGQDKP